LKERRIKTERTGHLFTETSFSSFIQELNWSMNMSFVLCFEWKSVTARKIQRRPPTGLASFSRNGTKHPEIHKIFRLVRKQVHFIWPVEYKFSDG